MTTPVDDDARLVGAVGRRNAGCTFVADVGTKKHMAGTVCGGTTFDGARGMWILPSSGTSRGCRPPPPPTGAPLGCPETVFDRCVRPPVRRKQSQNGNELCRTNWHIVLIKIATPKKNIEGERQERETPQENRLQQKHKKKKMVHGEDVAGRLRPELAFATCSIDRSKYDNKFLFYVDRPAVERPPARRASAAPTSTVVGRKSRERFRGRGGHTCRGRVSSTAASPRG